MNCSRFNRRRRFGCGIVLVIAAIGSIESAQADEPVRVTTDGTLKLSPVFVGNGDEVAFATHERANLVSIVRLRLSDGSRRSEHPTVTSHQFDPAFSRDGRLHAYAMSSVRRRWSW